MLDCTGLWFVLNEGSVIQIIMEPVDLDVVDCLKLTNQKLNLTLQSFVERLGG